MSTTTTWPGGATDASPTAYTIPASGELNWAALSNFLNVLATSAQSTTAQKWGVRKALTTPVTVSATADCCVVTQLTSPAAVAVNLPAGANKQVFVVVDGTGDAATNNVTITRNGSDTIAGATTLVLNKNRQAVVLVYNASDTDWKIASNTSPASSLVPAAGNVYSDATSLQRVAFTSNNVMGVNNAGTSAETKAFAAGTSGTDFAVAHAVNTITYNLPDAGASARGAVTTGTQTLAGAKTFTSALLCTANQSRVTVHTGNGVGAVATKVRRFTTQSVNVGSDITYADSANNGATFTINSTGYYSILYFDGNGASATANMFVLTKNDSGGTGSGSNLSNGLLLAQMATSAVSNQVISCSGIYFLATNDVIRAYIDTASNMLANSLSGIIVIKVL